MALIVTDNLGNAYQLSVNAADQSLSLSPSHSTPSPSGANSITVKVQDILSAALQEIGALAAGEPVPLNELPWLLQKLQRLIDRYNARQAMVYNVNFSRFTLPVNKQPITIGPGAMFDVNQRPVDIESISVILNNTTPAQVELLLNRRDQKWWAAQAVKNLTSTLPTDFYYSPDWPNGSIYLWPIPTMVNDLRIQTRLVLSEVTSYTQSFSMPPAYWDAIVYPLAVSLCPSYERTATPELLELERRSLKAIETNNVASPRGTVADAGMPGVGRRGDFNYYSGMPNQ